MATQEEFIKKLQDSKIPVTVFLMNGVKLQGTITGADAYCVLLTRDNHAQLVYKHAVSTVMPQE